MDCGSPLPLFGIPRLNRHAIKPSSLRLRISAGESVS
jgi:hypothetical protein